MASGDLGLAIYYLCIAGAIFIGLWVLRPLIALVAFVIAVVLVGAVTLAAGFCLWVKERLFGGGR